MPLVPEEPPFASVSSPAVPALGYYGRGTAPRNFRWWRGIWVIDMLAFPREDDARRWWGPRLLYYAAMFALFLTIGFYVGPNEILFRRVLYPYASTSDYIPEITTNCVPLVRAVKEYQCDHLRLPADVYQVVPGYLASCPLPATIMGDQLYFLKGDHLICYDFGPVGEGWTVLHGRVNGIVPAPLVTVGPATRPASVSAP